MNFGETFSPLQGETFKHCKERDSLQAGAVQKETGSPNYFKFTREFKSAKI